MCPLYRGFDYNAVDRGSQHFGQPWVKVLSCANDLYLNTTTIILARENDFNCNSS